VRTLEAINESIQKGGAPVAIESYEAAHRESALRH
jgi:hypothetical protein